MLGMSQDGTTQLCVFRLKSIRYKALTMNCAINSKKLGKKFSLLLFYILYDVFFRLELNLCVEQLRSAEITIDDLQKQLNNLPKSEEKIIEVLTIAEEVRIAIANYL